MTAFWAGRRVLVTGHTGFKGAWLCLWLERLGAVVSAFALPPDTKPALSAILASANQDHAIADLNDAAAVAREVARARPQIIIHMAAQALVRRSYTDPVGTFATNIMGTVNLLSSLTSCHDLEAVVVVTTDKVYENADAGHPFVETDPLGGKDPYSASKACAEIVSHCFRQSVFRDRPALATARAGNVVGGGDWSQDRLVPDVVRALAKGEPIRLRHPRSVRPWQHVLEPLAGYLALAQALVERPASVPAAINFGPDPKSFASARDVAEALARAFDAAHAWEQDPGVHPPEATTLTLNSDLARSALGWTPRLSLADTLAWTADWYRAHREGVDMHKLSLDQIAAYEELPH